VRAPIAAISLLLAACSGTQLAGGAEENDPDVEGLASAEVAAYTPEDDLLPSASKNGRYLAFASEQNGNLDIWVRDFATRSTYPITDVSAEDYDPAISPANDRIAFASRSEDAKGDIFVTKIQTAASRDEPLTDSTTADRQPMWSPDGGTIYYTSAFGIGLESIHAIDLESEESRRISPTPGFDPAPSPDGKYLVYTAATGVSDRRYPHLVALRLADTATRALTIGDAPEGFARFSPDGRSLVYVRFADDDSGDGVLDGTDLASLWSLAVDLDVLFLATPTAYAAPIPLTDGRSNDLFPEVTERSIYFTQGDRQQDVMRLPRRGMFPEYAKPERYFALAELTNDARTRLFIFRAALARTAPGSLLYAQSLLRIGNLHLETARDDLAIHTFRELAGSPAQPNTPEAELKGIGEVELLALERRSRLAVALAPVDRERALRATESGLDDLRESYNWTTRVQARVALEAAEVIVDRGDRPRAIDALERVSKTYADQPFSAARAMLRQIELLGIAHDPDALGEAYARVLSRFPEQREAVRVASERIVRVQLEGLGANVAWREKVDALSRLIPRYGDSPVRAAAREMLAALLIERTAYDDAALQLERLVIEAGPDRVRAARALQELARVDEARGRPERALAEFTKLRSAYGDLPGIGIEAREAVTRVGTKLAALAEERGDLQAARAAYASIIENDLSQVRAHRRWFALSKETGQLEAAIQIARDRAERSPLTPTARYAYALGLTWEDPPALEEASVEIAEALRLNPRMTHAYITRGWISEMQELEKPGWFERTGRTFVRAMNTAFGSLFPLTLKESDPLELSLEDYQRAVQLNPEAEDPETESEAVLNAANVSYRLGERTSDAGFFKRALGGYVEVLISGYRFSAPVAELVYYERFGRAAVWSEEWALSTMATRRAIEIAKRIAQPSRLAQLYGTLSLAYDQAGEDAYSRDALARSSAQLEERKLEEKLVLAKRNRAASKLLTISERTPEMLDSALEDLRSARELAEDADLAHGDEIPMWVAATPDPSSAQYGFGPSAELDVNLALAAQVHRAQGEVSRANAIAQARLAVTEEIMDDVPSTWGIDKEPTVLLTHRERFSFLMQAAKEALARNDRLRAEQLFTEADEELAGLVNNGKYAADQTFIHADRGRLLAVRVEDHAIELSRDPQLGLRIELFDAIAQSIEAVQASLKPVATTTVAVVVSIDPLLAALRDDLATIEAIDTATRAASQPILEPLAQDANAVLARLYHGRALLKLAETSRPLALAKDLPAVLHTLDTERTALIAARTDFELAARHAAMGGPGLGALIFASALSTSAELSSSIGDRPPAVLEHARAMALSHAVSLGRTALVFQMSFARALALDGAALEKARTELEAAHPQELGVALPLAMRILTRSASIALGKNDLSSAFSSVDRAMLLEGAAKRGVSLENAVDPADRELGRRARILFDQLEAARAELALSHGGDGPEVFLEKKTRLVTRKKALAELRDIEASDAAKARIFAEPQLPDLVVENVRAGESLLIPVPLEGQLGLLFVNGATLAESLEERLSFRTAVLSPRELVLAIREARAALALDRQPPAEVVERIYGALFKPFEAELKGVRTLFLADLLIEGPVPSIFGGKLSASLAHVSAPTALAASRTVQLIGAEGRVAIGRDEDQPMFAVDERLRSNEALEFKRTLAPPAPSGEKKQRSLDERSLAERLEDRARETLIIEAPLFLEPAALERSVIVLRGSQPASALEDEDDRRAAFAREADRFRDELPLEAIDVPASIVVLARVMESAPGFGSSPVKSTELLRLDLVLGLRGQGTLIAVPNVVPAEAAKRVIEATLADASPDAFNRAIEAEAKTHPAAQLIALVGAPRLGAEEAKALAGSELKGAQARSIALLKKEQWSAAVPAFARWIRLMRASGETKALESAWPAMISLLAERLDPPQYARAADEQTELIAFLETKPKTTANEKAVQNARVMLGRLQGLAGDFDTAEATFASAHEELSKLGDGLAAARATFELARHFETNRADFKRAVALYEEAIAAFEKEKAFEKKPPPEEAMRAVRTAGAIYLNRLSDPVRAASAYERALRYAQSEDEKNTVVIDLARVARRSGDFAAASARAEQARVAAVKLKRLDLEISAVIEAANVSWYRGDYRRGQDLCNKSLELIDTMKADKQAAVKTKRRRRIYALSVCGLLAMSRREQSTATEHLLHARRLAESIREPSEIATQDNNLGRAYLEFGDLDSAVESFQRARQIDEGLKDRFALAYDLRNLGTALIYKGAYQEAKSTLERGLEYANRVQDANNELRALFALGELARETKDYALARKQYAAALPIAESLDVKEIAWQIHRALGLMLREEKKLEEAEEKLWNAVKIVRSITGRSAATDFGPQRYAAFDDLIALLLDKDRVAEAFSVLDLARRLEQTELLDDSRITFATEDVPRLLREAREAKTATTADAALARLEIAEPQLARILRPVSVEDLMRDLPADAAVIVYRVTDNELYAFVADNRGMKARRTAISGKELAQNIREYGRALTARADISVSNAQLAAVLFEPLKELLAEKKRVAIVAHRLIRYVAFAALPYGENDALIDHYTLVSALDPSAAARVLREPIDGATSRSIIALGAPAAVLTESPLPYAKKELEMIAEEYPRTEALSGEAVTRASLLSALSRADGVFHFAGHSRLGASADGSASFVDPLGGELRVSDGGVTLFDILSSDMKAELVVLSACSSMLARTTPSSQSTISGDEMLSLAQSFAIAGAKNVLATTMHVSDIAAAMMMKRFYRESKKNDAATALKNAQLVVRKHFPHPAWWATYSLLAGE
jgi:CHAT domain-containing protein/tetratricopeptide (TPR) repeat protein